MGRLFTSFDEAWGFFVDRRDPLEDGFASLPADQAFLLTWLIVFDDTLVPAVQAVQGMFSHLNWVVPQPEHFLHASLGGIALTRHRPTAREIGGALEYARRAWKDTPVFEVTYRRINCFHTAVVVEVEGDGPRLLVERLVEDHYWGNLEIEGALREVSPETYLAHLTIGTVKGGYDPAPLREALIPLRDVEVGAQRVSEATLCLIPASRGTLLSPWAVVGSVPLGFRPRHQAPRPLI